jgi:hypothetical protein
MGVGAPMIDISDFSDAQVLEQLREKRAELVAQIEQARIEMRHLVTGVDQIDGVIHLFDPDAKIIPILQPSPTPRYAASKGEVSRAVLETLRSEGRPMGTRQIMLRVMAERGLTVDDRELANLMNKRTSACLKQLRRNGMVREAASAAGPVREWEIVR